MTNKQLYREAHKAGLAAAEMAAKNTEDGFPCGFAWVKVRPATAGFCRWLRKQDYSNIYKSYSGGLDIMARTNGQGVDRKDAWATGYCKGLEPYLPQLGVKVYAQSRLD